MASRIRTERALSILLRTGVLGASAVLATAQANSPPSAPSAPAATPESSSADVAERLQTIREIAGSPDVGAAMFIDPDEKTLLAQWVNFGIGSPAWRNGGWRNVGPWRNAAWGPGWRNAGPWRNSPWVAPWSNWRNGPWNNFWRNW